jgi:hypothetical protein
MYTTAFYRNKLGFDKNWASLRNFNTTTNSPIIIDKRTQLMWFGFNFSDAKDYATIAQYQNTSKQNKTWKTQTRFPALLQMKTEIHYPAPASQ